MPDSSPFISPVIPAGWRTQIEALSLPAIVGFALLALAWLLPGHYLPWMMFQQEVLAALSSLLICWAAVEKNSRAVWPIPAAVALVAAIVPWIQHAAGLITFLTDALLPSAYLVALALAICAAATLATGTRRGQLLDGFAASCVFAAIVSSGMALYQWLQLPPPGPWLSEVMPGGRVFANFGQPNHLSSMLALGIAGALRWYEIRRVRGWVATLAIAWLAWGMAMTESRTAWMFAVVASVGTVVLRRRASLRTSPTAVVVGIALFAVAASSENWLHAAWNDDGATMGMAARVAAGVRTLHWRVLADAALRAPWLGYGWNQIPRAQFAAAADHAATGEVLMQSHNLLLDLVLYNGVPIGLMLFGGLALWVARTLRACRDAESWCLMLALLALLAHALVEYPLHYLYFLLPAGLIVGALEVMTNRSVQVMPAFPKATLWLPALVMSGLLVWVGTEYLRAEEALRRLRFASARVGITLADLHSPDLTLLDGWKAYHDASRISVNAGMSPADMELIRETTERFPYPAALFRYAHALALNQEQAAARQELQYFCKVYPKHIQVIIQTAWEEQQAKEEPLKSVDFPKCAE